MILPLRRRFFAVDSRCGDEQERQAEWVEKLKAGVSSERLKADIDEEFQILNTYSQSSRRLDEWQDEISELIDSRRHWPRDQKLTPGEATLVENVCGPNFVEEYYAQFSTKYEDYDSSEDELLRLRFHILLLCKNMPPSMVSFMGATSKNRSPTHIESFLKTHLDSLPSVHPEKGFAPNSEVLSRHEQHINDLTDRIKDSESLNLDQVPWDFPFKSPRSPFGPVSSSACYEELGALRAVHLKELLNRNGRIIPRTKIFLTVKVKAIVLPSLIVTTVVQDEMGQHVALQVHNMKNVTPTTNGIDALPVGARFYLKNPFLKIGRDGWLLLRVDQPFDLERLDLPPLNGNILIVGDGDFSFSVALARENCKRGSAKITVSSLDTQETVERRYGAGASNLAALTADPSVFLVYELDATLCGAFGSEPHWDSIVWNFPYPDGKKGASASEGNILLAGFFDNLHAALKPEGRAYVTLAQEQGGTTRDAAGSKVAWGLESLASDARLELVEVLPFQVNDFEGYEPRRAYADESFPFENARIHILRHRQEDSLPGEAASERSPLSRMSSYLIDKMTWGGPQTHIHVAADDAIELLTPYADTSAVARKMRKCAETFKHVQLLIAGNFEKGNKSIEELLIPSADVTDLLYTIFAVDNGELVVKWESQTAMTSAIFSSRLAVLHPMLPWLSKTDTQELASRADDNVKFMRYAKDLYCQISGSMDEDHNGALAKAVYVAIRMEAYANTADDFVIIDVWLHAIPRDPWLYCYRATLLAGRHFVNLDADEHLRFKVIDNCNKVLDLIKCDKTHDLYQRTIYILACTYRSRTTKESLLLSASLYNEYIELCDPTDRFLPAAHYHAGVVKYCIAFVQRNGGKKANNHELEQARLHYQAGLAAEQDRVPFFGPVMAESKALLSIVTMTKQQNKSQKQPQAATAQKQPQATSKPVPTMKKPIQDKWCNANQVCQLVKDAQGKLHMGMFKHAYMRRYGKEPFIKGAKVKKALQELSSSSGKFKLKNLNGDGCSFWITKK